MDLEQLYENEIKDRLSELILKTEGYSSLEEKQEIEKVIESCEKTVS